MRYCLHWVGLWGIVLTDVWGFGPLWVVPVPRQGVLNGMSDKVKLSTIGK